MSIGFRKMVERSEVIAVARVTGEPRWETHHVDLELTTILKGHLEPGRYRVRFADLPRVSGDESEFVAFLRTGLCWRFVARPIMKGTGVADSLLQVEGFYDWNAYIVSPGLVSLKQIETIIKERTLSYTFQGPLYFPKRGQLCWDPSPLEIEVVYDAVTEHATVKGLPEYKGFPAQPRVDIGGLFRRSGGISLTYSRYTQFPLELGGEVGAPDPKTGVLPTRFFIEDPNLLTPEDLNAYLTNPHHGRSYLRCKLACAPLQGEAKPRQLTLTLEKDPGNSMGQLEGWTDQPLEVTRIEYKGPTGQSIALSSNLPPGLAAPNDQWSYRFFFRLGGERYLILQFEVGEPAEGEGVFGNRHDTSRALLYALIASDAKGKVSVYANEAIRDQTTFTASIDGVFFRTLAQPRTAHEEPPEANHTPVLDYDSGGEDYVDCDPKSDTSRTALWTVVIATGVLLTVGLLVWRRWKKPRDAQ